jgi:hypothetical protein
MSPSDNNQERPIAQEPEPGAALEPAAPAEAVETNEPDLATGQESAAKRTVLVTVSDCVCAALACATSVR